MNRRGFLVSLGAALVPATFAAVALVPTWPVQRLSDFQFRVTVRNMPLNLQSFLRYSSCVGRRNARPWNGFAAGEVLYLGLAGEWRNPSWELVHTFRASRAIGRTTATHMDETALASTFTLDPLLFLLQSAA